MSPRGGSSSPNRRDGEGCDGVGSIGHQRARCGPLLRHLSCGPPRAEGSATGQKRGWGRGTRAREAGVQRGAMEGRGRGMPRQEAKEPRRQIIYSFPPLDFSPTKVGLQVAVQSRGNECIIPGLSLEGRLPGGVVGRQGTKILVEDWLKRWTLLAGGREVMAEGTGRQTAQVLQVTDGELKEKEAMVSLGQSREGRFSVMEWSGGEEARGVGVAATGERGKDP